MGERNQHAKRDMDRRDFLTTGSAAVAGAVAASSLANVSQAEVKAEKTLSGNLEDKTMKILALDKILPGATEEKIKSLMHEEAVVAVKHYLAGSIREWYFRQDRPGVVLVLECGSLDEATKLLDELPLAKAGLVGFDLIPLGPFVPLGMLLK